MDAVDESILEREGATAAARGLSWQSNPYLRRDLMPASTGESLNRWARKHDAWQRGFEAYGGKQEWPFSFDVGDKGFRRR